MGETAWKVKYIIAVSSEQKKLHLDSFELLDAKPYNKIGFIKRFLIRLHPHKM